MLGTAMKWLARVDAWLEVKVKRFDGWLEGLSDKQCYAIGIVACALILTALYAIGMMSNGN